MRDNDANVLLAVDFTLKIWLYFLKCRPNQSLLFYIYLLIKWHGTLQHMIFANVLRKIQISK